MKNNYYIIYLIFFSFILPEDNKYVSEVHFSNNITFSHNELESVIMLKSQNLFIRNKFSLKKFNRDIMLLESFYKSRGYLDININANYTEVVKNYINIFYTINEGLNYNLKKIPHKGSAIFFHLTKDYKPTVGCVALKEKDFLIMLKLINNKTKIKIY